jgi:hypothetical protein
MSSRFADHIAIVINEKFLSTVCELLQKALFLVQTSMVLFTNKRKLGGFKKPILLAKLLLEKTWGLKPKVVYCIYTSVVRPILI